MAVDYEGRGGCLEGWNGRQKCLLAFTIILAILAAALLGVFLYFILTHMNENKADGVCMTKNCTITAATLLTAIDSSINPCEDFNKFACGDFIRKNPVPEGKIMTTTFLQYKDSYNLQIKSLIESHNPFLGDPDVVFRAQESYHVCINRTYNMEAEITEFKKLLNETFGGWPMVMGTKWKMPNVNLEEIWGKLSRTGVFGFMYAYLAPTKENPNDNILQIGISPMSTPNTTDEDKYKLQLRIMKIVVDLLGYSKNVDVSDLDKSFVKMEEIEKYFEKELDELEELNSMSESYKTMTIKELDLLTEDTFDWLLYLNTLFKGIHTFKRDEAVIVHNPERIAIFDNILKYFLPRDIINVLAWNIIDYGLLELLSPEIEDIYLESINGKSTKWETCLEWVKDAYPLVVTRLFLQKFVDRKNKETADEMVQLVQEAYRERIKNSNWLDEETKKNAILKADSIQRFIGYPDFIFDDKKLEHVYSYMPKVHSTLVANYKEIVLQKYKSYWEGIHKPLSKEREWEDASILSINAFYDPGSNTIWFPSGILQLPFFDENRVAAINFGMIGAIIGHEIGHAFDDSGSLFDEQGNRRNWWTNSTRMMYEKKAECFVQQYSQYCPEELKGGKDDKPICVDGSQTLGENLADNTGLRAAFDAYTLWTNKHGKEKLLPGLEEYTPEQLFFISFGYLWCQNLPIDKWVDRYKDDPHSPMSYRNVGALANNEKFREAFKCTERNLMNRGSESCTVW